MPNFSFFLSFLATIGMALHNASRWLNTKHKALHLPVMQWHLSGVNTWNIQTLAQTILLICFRSEQYIFLKIRLSEKRMD